MLRAKFWGVRGSIPLPGPDTIKFGGNTSCVEVDCNGEIIIIDGGTGLRPLGLDLVQRGAIAEGKTLSIFFSHVHWDHIQGVPFFRPAFMPGVIRAGIRQLVLFHHGREDKKIAEIESLAGQEFSNTIAAYEGLEIRLS